MLREIIANIEEGTLGGESFTLTLENGGLEMQYTENLDAELVELAEETVEGIIAGDIVPLPELEEGDMEATEEPGS